MNSDKIIHETYLSKKNNRLLTFFWFGFVLYTVSFAIYTADVLNRVFCVSLQLIGLILLIPAAFRLIKFKISDNYLKTIYIPYCGWLLTIIFRGLHFDFTFLKQMFFFPFFGILLYFVPLILLFPLELKYYKHVFNAIITLGLFYLFYDLLFVNSLLYVKGGKSQDYIEYFTHTLSIPSGFILLTYIYHSIKRNLLALIVIFITMVLAIIQARRGLIFMSGNILAVFILIYCYANRKRAYLPFSLIVLSLMCISVIYFYTSNKSFAIFSFINERINEDTRTIVEEFFYEDMKQKDWIIGKGLDGMYYAPNVGEGNRNAPYRDGIETDYLAIILKGGIISLGLLLLIAVPAVLKGLFFSKNVLSKASAFWIVLWILALYPAPVTAFTLNYLLVWLSIGICYSKTIRNLPDSYIKEAFMFKSYPNIT